MEQDNWPQFATIPDTLSKQNQNWRSYVPEAYILGAPPSGGETLAVVPGGTANDHFSLPSMYRHELCTIPYLVRYEAVHEPMRRSGLGASSNVLKPPFSPGRIPAIVRYIHPMTAPYA